MVKLISAVNPAIIPTVGNRISVIKQTANALIKDFHNPGILKKTGYKRNRIFVFEKYLRLFERSKFIMPNLVKNKVHFKIINPVIQYK